MKLSMLMKRRWSEILSVSIKLFGDLHIFLPRDKRENKSFEAKLTRRTSIKDFLEAYGIPHPEIYKLIVNGRERGFDYIVLENDHIEVIPFLCPVVPTEPTLLRSPLEHISFAVDVNVCESFS